MMTTQPAIWAPPKRRIVRPSDREIVQTFGFGFGAGPRQTKVVEPVDTGDFDPTSVANCRCAYRASLGVTDDGTGKASAWADQSGAGDANRDLAQGTSGNRPTINSSNAGLNGRASIDFDGTDDYMASAAFTGGVYAQPTTWYVVLRADRTNATNSIFDSNDSANRNALLFNVNAWLPFAGGSEITGGTAATATSYVACVVFNSASSAMYKNRYNTTEVTGDFGSNGFHSLRVGAHVTLAVGYYFGALAEIIGYSGAHDATTRQTVMESLGTMYGVTITS